MKNNRSLPTVIATASSSLLLCAALLLAGCGESNVAEESANETGASHSAEHALLATVTDDNFEAFVNESPVAVVDFWATWCPPCRTMEPRFESAASALEGVANFGKLDVDRNGKTATELQISAIPSILIFKEGKLVDKIVGVVSEQDLVQRVQQYN